MEGMTRSPSEPSRDRLGAGDGSPRRSEDAATRRRPDLLLGIRCPRSRRPTDGLLLAFAIVGGVVLRSPRLVPPRSIPRPPISLPSCRALRGGSGRSRTTSSSSGPSACSCCPCSHRGGSACSSTRCSRWRWGRFAILAGAVSGIDPSKSLSGLINSSSPRSTLRRVAIATTVIVTASPFLTRPIRLIGRWLIAIGALSGSPSGPPPIGVGAGFLIGLGSAALVHLLFGSPGGRLTLDQVTEALRELGVQATATRDAAAARGVAVTLASTPEGRPLVVKIFGRDAQDGQLVAATWSAISPRAKPVSAGRLEQVEHEAFLTLAARGGTP